MHGADAFAYPVTLSEECEGKYPGLESSTRAIYLNEINSKSFNLLYRSAVGCIDMPEFINLEYVFDECLEELLGRGEDAEVLPRFLFLRKALKSTFAGLLNKPYAKVPTEKLDSIFRYRARYTRKLETPPISIHEDLLALRNYGSAEDIRFYSYCFFNGENGFSRDVPRAIEMCKDAAELGDSAAKEGLSSYLAQYGGWLMFGENGFSRDIPKAIEIYKELSERGCEEVKSYLPRLLASYSVWVFYGQNGITRDIQKAIQVCREAAERDDESSIHNLPLFLKDYALWLYNGENGISKDIPKAVEVCRESVTLGNQEAKSFFPTLLNNYAAWLFRGENGIEQNLAMAVKVCREAAELGNEEAIAKLPTMLVAIH